MITYVIVAKDDPLSISRDTDGRFHIYNNEQQAWKVIFDNLEEKDRHAYTVSKLDLVTRV